MWYYEIPSCMEALCTDYSLGPLVRKGGSYEVSDSRIYLRVDSRFTQIYDLFNSCKILSTKTDLELLPFVFEVYSLLLSSVRSSSYYSVKDYPFSCEIYLTGFADAGGVFFNTKYINIDSPEILEKFSILVSKLG